MKEDPIAALRNEIRDTGRITRRGRCIFLGSVLTVTVVPAALGVWSAITSGEGSLFLTATGLTGTGVMAAALTVAAAAGSAIALATAAVYRTLYRSSLRQRLLAVPPAARSEILVPLQSERLADTRKIVLPLLRDLNLPTELAPAPPPDAHGDEPSPAADAGGD